MKSTESFIDAKALQIINSLLDEKNIQQKWLEYLKIKNEFIN